MAPQHELVYPITPDYVSTWDVERALAELVANAYDEDPACKVTYRDGALTIVDQGSGWTEETLILGHSTKSDTQIGQFGEGVKLALLVLARENRSVSVTTSGRHITARIDRRTLGWSANGRTHELLVVTSEPARQRRGTRIEVSCSSAEAAGVRSRFLRLERPRYRTPQHGRVLPDKAGDIYVGGVRIITGRDLHFGYDLPLEGTKHLINRDRDVIDGWELGRLIGQSIADTTDSAVIVAFTRAALNGNLSRQEQHISGLLTRNTATDRQWRRIGRRVLLEGIDGLPRPHTGRSGRPQYYWDDRSETRDIHYALKDRGWALIPATLGSEAHRELMTKIGVPHVDSVTLERERLSWIGRERLTEHERRNLSLVTRRGRRHFGSIPTIRIYTAHENPDTLGFFDSGNERICLRRDQLADMDRLATTLIHELAHWHAWRNGRDWHDRTRDFETTLSELAATILTGQRRRRV
jgi:hypothetical protein